jgi:hypothetical protein
MTFFNEGGIVVVGKRLERPVTPWSRSKRYAPGSTGGVSTTSMASSTGRSRPEGVNAIVAGTASGPAPLRAT